MPDEQAALKAVETDAATPPDGPLVPLITESGEVKLTVPPPGKWKTRATSMLRTGDIDGWAELVLSDDDFEAWQEAEPTNEDAETFFRAWAEVSGEKLGKSSASQRSSKSTARR